MEENNSPAVLTKAELIALGGEEVDGCNCNEDSLCLVHMTAEEKDYWESVILPTMIGG